MTVMDKFFNWQDSGLDFNDPRFEKCQPACRTLEDFMMYVWGGQLLGCHGDRDIIGGSKPSTHAYGAAPDWRYENPGIGRQRMLDEVIPFLIDNSAELGIQAIHDYAGSRIWRPPGTSGRGPTGTGWLKQKAGSQMGQSWALWLHIEIHIDDIDDGRPVVDKLGLTPGEPHEPPAWEPPPVIEPPVTEPPATGGTYMQWLNTIKAGASGTAVTILQGLLKSCGYSIQIDGAFGRQTDDAVRWYQGVHGLTIDGVVGPQTWHTLGADGPKAEGGESDAA